MAYATTVSMAPDAMVRLQIGGLTLTLRSATPDLQVALPAAMQPFQTADPAPEIQLRARWAELRRETSGTRLFDAGPLWQLYRQEGGYCFRFRSEAVGPMPYKEAVFTPDWTRGEVRLHRPYFAPDQPVYPLEYPLDELLLLHWLSQGHGVLVHAAGLVLSDERSIVRLQIRFFNR